MWQNASTMAVTVLPDRTLPGAEGEGGGDGFNTFNLVFVVGFALLISFLAMRLARRGGRGGRK